MYTSKENIFIKCNKNDWEHFRSYVTYSTFLEIQFPFTKLTKLAKLTNVHSSVSLHILHPDALCKKHTRIDFMSKVHSKALLQNTLEDTLLHKLHSVVQFARTH